MLTRSTLAPRFGAVLVLFADAFHTGDTNRCPVNSAPRNSS
ncbi:hypothetical protein [Actinopolyspora xinjiangensis]|nr:hypothetical protein [Actinopolyspora xinjiangensis]